jgi:hypothetical protein
VLATTQQHYNLLLVAAAVTEVDLCAVSRAYHQAEQLLPPL